jgi:hypothetical protein
MFIHTVRDQLFRQNRLVFKEGGERDVFHPKVSKAAQLILEFGAGAVVVGGAAGLALLGYNGNPEGLPKPTPVVETTRSTRDQLQSTADGMFFVPGEDECRQE